MSIEIIDIQGTGSCNFGHKVGQKFDIPEDRGKICSAAYNSLYPYLVGLTYGAEFPWEEDKNSCTICCPDYKNPVVFKIVRSKTDE